MMNDILEVLIAKNNELESLKEHVDDPISLNIIKAKQDTINDIYKYIESKRDGKILSIGDEN